MTTADRTPSYQAILRKTEHGYLAVLPELNVVARGETVQAAIDAFEKRIAMAAAEIADARAMGILPSESQAAGAAWTTSPSARRPRSVATDLAMLAARTLTVLCVVGIVAGSVLFVGVRKMDSILSARLNPLLLLEHAAARAESASPENLELVARQIGTIVTKLEPLLAELAPLDPRFCHADPAKDGLIR